MLDLSKPLGIHEGVIFYGDHELNSLVYYFPDEVSLAPQTGAGAEGLYELFFQVFNEGGTIEGSLDDLRKSAGSILSLGIQCAVAPKRLEKAMEKLKGSAVFPENLSATLPPWTDGSVNLMVLDSITTKDTSIDKDSFVKSIIGSNKPSLMSSDLKSIFNVRLDRRGTALTLAGLEGEAGNVAGVLYDLKYLAIRPALDLRIWANLGRCYDSVSHQLGIKAEFTYYVKFSLGAELEWVTRKLIEDGDMKIEVLSQAEDPETKKMIDEMVKDFKTSILQEMFRPYVNPQTPNVGAAVAGAATNTAASLVPTIGVAYRFTSEKISHDKVIDVDFRERSTVTRTHNPQSHLWVFGKQIKANRDQYIQHVVFSDIWREQVLKIQLIYDFTLPESDLLNVELIVWRAKDGVKENVKEGRFSLPDNTAPLKNVSFNKLNNGLLSIAWNCERTEPIGYFYQLRFVYDTNKTDIISPAEIVTPPTFSTSESLNIYPDTYIFFRRVEIREGNISFDEIKTVDVSVKLKNNAGEVLESETIVIDETHKNGLLSVRGKDKDALDLEVTKNFFYNDQRPSISTAPSFLLDNEVIVNKPFLRSTFKIIPVIAGKNDAVVEILLEIIINSPDLTDPLKDLYRIKGPAFDTTDIDVLLHSDKDKISFKATAITKEGKILDISDGPVATNALVIDLKNTTIRKVSFEWTGPSPDALGLKTLTVELKRTNGGVETQDSIVFAGANIPAPILKIFDPGEKVQFRLVKRFQDGSKEKGEFSVIEENQLIVKIQP